MVITIASAMADYVAAMEPIVAAPVRLRSAAARALADASVIADQRGLDEWVRAYTAGRTGVSAATVKRELIVVRAAMSRAWKRGNIGWKPYVALPHARSRRQRWLTADEARAVAAHIPPRSRLAWQILTLTGCRVGAMLDLTWDRVDFGVGVVDFRRDDDPKAARRKSRAIAPMTDALRAALRAARTTTNSTAVVPLSADTVRRDIAAAASKAGVTGVTPHVIRHSVATWLLAEERLPLSTVAAILGHRDSRITEIVYAHLVPAHLFDAAQALAARMGPQPPTHTPAPDGQPPGGEV